MLIVAATARAQADKETFVISAPLSFEQLGYREGLPQSEIRAMAQDAQGFVWLGTQAGLARYDGYKMRVYRPEAGTSGTALIGVGKPRPFSSR